MTISADELASDRAKVQVWPKTHVVSTMVALKYIAEFERLLAENVRVTVALHALSRHSVPLAEHEELQEHYDALTSTYQTMIEVKDADIVRLNNQRNDAIDASEAKNDEIHALKDALDQTRRVVASKEDEIARLKDEQEQTVAALDAQKALARQFAAEHRGTYELLQRRGETVAHLQDEFGEFASDAQWKMAQLLEAIDRAGYRWLNAANRLVQK